MSDPAPAPSWARDRGVLAGLSLIALVTVVDLAVSVELTGGYYSMGAILTSLMASVLRTSLVGAVAVALGVSVGALDDLGSTQFALRVVIIVSLVVVAMAYASVRERREARLRRMTVIADAAQRAVLRSTPDAIGSTGLATRYVSASEEASVGGDLYEIAATPFGVRVIVGDVRGKGLPAVQTAASVLGAFRKAAFSEPDPAALAAAIDDVVSRLIDEEEFITAILAEFGDDTVALANCGHHPPLLVDHGQCRFLDTGEPTTPLGLRPEPVLTRHPWSSQDRLLLYTDGLVETRDRRGAFFPLDDQATDLTAAPLSVALDKIVDRLREFAGGRIPDDVALVLVENRHS